MIKLIKEKKIQKNEKSIEFSTLVCVCDKGIEIIKENYVNEKNQLFKETWEIKEINKDSKDEVKKLKNINAIIYSRL